ncbi:MAG: metal ABC transporter permease [Syntrophorhabdus sp.]
MDIINLLSHGFIQRALMAGSFIAILCATLGTFLVLRRFSLIGDGLAHVTFGGVAVGLFLRVYPMYVAIPIVMISSLGILKLVEKARLYGDAAIGIVSSLGIAWGILLASAAGGFNIDLFSYLFGNILTISTAEVISSILLSLVLILIIWFYYHELLSITFDEESAKVSGIKTKTINGILVLLTSMTVVLAMRVVGIMLISSLLILPPVTALQVAKGFKMTIVIASACGVISVILGIFLSLALDLPTGATIVILNFLFFMGSFVFGKLLAR